LEILLFLSAMLAGLTGLISGDRAVETRQVERTMVAAVAGAEQIAVDAQSERLVARAETPAFAAAPVPAHSEAPDRGSEAPVDERRLE
jgi:hypothetical protein